MSPRKFYILGKSKLKTSIFHTKSSTVDAKVKCHVEAVVWRCSVKRGVLRNFGKFTGKHLCQNLFLDKVAGLWNSQVFSREFSEISNNTFSHGTPLVAASDHGKSKLPNGISRTSKRKDT